MNYKIEFNMTLKSEVDLDNDENIDDVIGKEPSKRFKRIFWIGYAIFAIIAFLLTLIEIDFPNHKYATYADGSQVQKRTLGVQPKK